MWSQVKSTAVCLGLVAAGVIGGFHLRAQAPSAPADTAAMRAHFAGQPAPSMLPGV